MCVLVVFHSGSSNEVRNNVLYIIFGPKFKCVQIEVHFKPFIYIYLVRLA